MATQYNGKTFTFTQPDGSKIQLRGWGDQSHAVFETLDGYTVTRNPATGYYEVAQLSAAGNALQPAPAAGGRLDGAAAGVPRGLRVPRESALVAGSESGLPKTGRRCDERREDRRQQMRAIRAMAAAGGPLLAPPQRQTVGEFVGLCLLIDFSDSPATISRDDVDRFCNQPGYTGFGNNGSVFDYFRDNSIGRLRYTSIVAPYYRARNPKAYYTDENIQQPVRAYELINEALAHLKATGFDFSPLTVDNQGFVYATNVYYAGSVDNNWAKGLWPHAYHLGSAVQLMPGKKAYDYQFTAMESELTLGTFCHENGHMLCDYPDLYDDEVNAQSSGVGTFCLMCAGNFNEKNPLPISAYLKRLSGWDNSVTPIEHGRVITLAAGTNDFALYSRSGREYFIIENRQKVGRDATLPDEGLAIWHVDEDGDNSREQMTPASHYELSLEQADGLFQLERQRNHRGDAGDLYAGPGARFANDTVPSSKWWNGTSSNLTIDQISSAGASVSFRCLLSDVVTPPTTLNRRSSPNRAIPDNTSVGVSDTINITEAQTISTIKVGVDITHTYRSDLRVTLTTPWGIAIELHPKGQGGNAHDLKITYDETALPALATLRGRSTQGAWQLTVQDLAPADTGRLNQWSLEFTAAAAVGPIELKESPGTPIPDFPNAGIERTLTATGTAKVGSIEVSVDISHTYLGDLRVSLVSPAGSEIVLHGRANGSQQNLASTFTAATTPALSSLVGQPAAGAWRLRISDHEARDQGKLNSWRVLIKT